MDKFETVVTLIRELPQEYRDQAAMQLSWLLKRAEDELTMSEHERDELARLEHERSAKLVSEVKEFLQRTEPLK